MPDNLMIGPNKPDQPSIPPEDTFSPREYLSVHKEQYRAAAFHGTTSAALYGLKRVGGFLPSGKLLETGNVVPYGGELLNGVTPTGVNRECLSLDVDIQRIMNQYAMGEALARSQWSAEKMRASLRLLEAATTDSELLMSIHTQQRLLFNKRLQVWETLTPQEQQWIQEPFPIVAGILPLDVDSLNKTVLHYRYPEGGGVPELNVTQLNQQSLGTTGTLCLYVPHDKIAELRTYFAGSSFSWHFEPLEPLQVIAQKTSWVGSYLNTLN